MQKSQSPLILRFPPVHLYLYQGNNAALDLVLSLVLLISFLGALREKSTRQCLIISCSSSCALGQGRIICLTSAVQGFSVCSVNHLLGICSDKTNTAPGNHSGEGKKKKSDSITSSGMKRGSAAFSLLGVFSSHFEGLHSYKDWENSIRASTQFSWNPLTCRALLLGLAFVGMTSATPFGLLSSGVFRLHFVFLIFKSKYFCIEKHREVPCCSCASRNTFQINLLQDKKCAVSLFRLSLLPV